MARKLIKKERKLHQRIERLERLVETEQFVDALDVAEELLAGSPQDVRLRRLKLEALSALDDFRGVVRLARELHAEGAADGRVVLLHASALFGKGYRALPWLLVREHPESGGELALSLGNMPRPAEWRILTEQATLDLLQGESREARERLLRLLELEPGSASVWREMLAWSYYLEGQYLRALSELRGLSQDSAVLMRMKCWCVTGQWDRAADEADQIHGAETYALGAALVEDYPAILDLAPELYPAEKTSRLACLLAFACQRLGKTKRAERFLRRALKLDPGDDQARVFQLAALSPEGERFDFYPFSLDFLLSPQVSDALDRGGWTEQTARAFTGEHPEILELLPFFLRNGCPTATYGCVMLALSHLEPEWVEPLREFGLGRRGPDKLRLQALAGLVARAHLAPGPVTVWREGKPGPVVLTHTELTYEKRDNFHSVKADRLAERAQSALLRNDLAGSERLLREALELEPENPVLWHNLGVTLRSDGRREEAEKLFEENHRRFPDYSFGLLQQADRLLKQGDVVGARELAAALLLRPRLHVREFSALCHLQMGIHDACGEPEASRAWFDRWVEVDPQHPALRGIPAMNHR